MWGTRWKTGAKRLTAIAALSCLVVISASGCQRETASESSQGVAQAASDSARDPAKEDAPSLAQAMPMGGEWRLVAIDHRELSSGGTPVVVFGDQGECWGNTGVNDFRTTFNLKGMTDGELKVGSAAVTRKAGPPEAMALERLFLERLETARKFEVEGDLLHLHAGEGQHLTLQRVLP